MKTSAINYFSVKKLVKEIGRQEPNYRFDEQGAPVSAYSELCLALEEFGRLLLADYPKLAAHVNTIGLANISKKMIESYK